MSIDLNQSSMTSYDSLPDSLFTLMNILLAASGSRRRPPESPPPELPPDPDVAMPVAMPLTCAVTLLIALSM